MIKEYIQKIKEGKLTEVKGHTIWLLKYSKNNVLFIFIFTLLGLSGTVIGLISSLASRDLIDIITGHNTGELVKTFVMLIVVQLASVVVGQVSSTISMLLVNKIKNRLKNDIYEELITSDWEEISEYHSGDLLSRWSSDSANVASGMLTFIPNVINCIFRFASSLFIVCKYDYTFAFFALVGVPITLISTRKLMNRSRESNLTLLEVSTEESSFAQESFSNIQTVKAFDMLNFYISKIRELHRRMEKETFKYQKSMVFNALIMTLISMLVTYSTYGWGIYKVWIGAISYGTLTLFLSMSNNLSATTQSLLSLAPQYITLINGVKRIREVIEFSKDDYSQKDEVKLFYENHSDEGIGLIVNDVSYTYPNGTEVFSRVSFYACPREVVALVGPSGEGKTTMLRLALSIIRAKEGNAYVTAGERKYADADFSMPLTAAARQLFAYVPQGNTMFSGTIAENMRNVKEDATDEEIENALKLACAWEFVSKLPDGINTELQERGGGFSEGQSQRLSIARALIRKSPILLLDEATSALDVWTEKAVLKNIMEDDYPRTTIVTTHRPSVLTVCDRVYKVHDKQCDIMTKEEIEEMVKVFIE